MACPRNIPRGRDFWAWPPAIAVLAVVALLLAFSATRIMARQWAIYQERRALEKKIEELTAEKTRLEEAIRSSGSQEAVERLAKEKLNLKNQGEEVVVITPETRAASATPVEPSRWSSEWFSGWLAPLVNFLRR